MKIFVSLLCVALVAVASGSPAKPSWLQNISNAVSDNISKATNIASEKGKEGVAKVQELLAELQKQAEAAQQQLQSAASEAQKAASEYLLKSINEQISKLKQVEEKLSGWMGKN